jgi:putative ABC transport system substrate-binding protein
VLLAAPLASEAQPGGKVSRIGVLLPGSPGPEYERRLDAFRQGLRERGYVEGQNLAIEYRWAHATFERLPTLVAELIGLKVDVLVIDGVQAGVAAKSATGTIPIVMAVVGDPVRTGLVGSLARPGGNITGMTLMTPELSAKRLELLKEVVPRATRVAVLLNPANRTHAVHWKEAEGAAARLHLKLQAVEVQRSADLQPALSTIAGWRADALFVFEDPLFLPARQTELVAFAAKHRLPTISGLRSLVDAGGLMSFGASFPDLFRQAATFVVKILKGAKPANLPVQQPTKLELVINLKTAQVLGLTIPQSVLLRADEVIR